jgi:hypothetical protein
MSELLRSLQLNGVVGISGHDVPSYQIQKWAEQAKMWLRPSSFSCWDSVDFETPRGHSKAVPDWLSESITVAEQIAAKVLEPAQRIRNAQLALVPKGFQRERQQWHVDNFEIALADGLTGLLPMFQIIVGIPLVDLSEVNRGNLAVEYGGHIRIANEILAARQEGKTFQAAIGEIRGKFYSTKTNLTPLLLRVGQPFLMHALTPHGITKNDFEDRRVLYFRFGQFPLSLCKWKSLEDMWLGFSPSAID